MSSRSVWSLLPAALVLVACSSAEPNGPVGNAALAGASNTDTGDSAEPAAGSGGAASAGNGAAGTIQQGGASTANDPESGLSGNSGLQGDSGQCVAKQDDPNNCGACFNRCGAVALASAQKFPTRLVADADNLYWTLEGTLAENAIMQMPRAGGTPIALATGQVPGDIAVDATRVYWTNATDDGSILSVPIGGGAITTLAEHQRGPIAIAVDATNVYWTTLTGTPCPESAPDCFRSGTIMKMPLAGGEPITLATDQQHPSGIAIDSTSVYWTIGGPTIFEGAIMKVAIDGGTPIAIAEHQSGVAGGLAVAGTNLYFTGNLGPNSLRTVSIDGGAVTSLSPKNANGAALTVSATGVFWIAYESSTASLLQLPFTGGTPKTLLSYVTASDVAVSGSDVYWTEGYSDGSIMKLGAVACTGGVCGCPAGQVPCFGTCTTGTCNP